MPYKDPEKRKQAKKAYDAKRAGQRSKNWATVVYPESAPTEWLTTLEELHTRIFVSPLHSEDVNADGTPKKPHYHVLFMFDGVKTKAQFQEVVKQINGVGCEQVSSMRAYARYLCHLDNPEKAQYNANDVLSFAGAIYDAEALSSSEKRNEIVAFIRDNNITEYAELTFYALENNLSWLDYIEGHTIFLNAVIKSYKYSSMESKVVSDTKQNEQNND